jgi:GDPmannose 4,6-dehydratase
MKSAIISGATGQDGSYMLELLLEKGYDQINCIVRRSTYVIEKSNISGNVLSHPKVKIFNSDLLDTASLVRVFEDCKDSDEIEVYNLAAQSDVGISFQCPRSTAETNYIGTLNILETIKQLDLFKKTKFYQASTSEMFGKVQEIPQTENTPFYPRSPYGISKLAAHWLVKNYRESYDLFGCCGILFNHESPRRGINFVTQKIVKGIRDVMLGHKEYLELGNLNSKRDWGHAKDYVEAMWLMLQQDNPDDYVVGSGVQYSVRDFVERVVTHYNATIQWEGEGVNEIGKDSKSGKVLIKVSSEFYRPCEVETLIADASKIKSIGWKPKISFNDLIDDMVGTEPKRTLEEL